MSATNPQSAPTSRIDAASAFPSDLWVTNNPNLEYSTSPEQVVTIRAFNDTYYQMQLSLQTIKAVKASVSVYTLAWLGHVSSQTAPSASNVLQQWFAPMWISADKNSYANFICSATVTQSS